MSVDGRPRRSPAPKILVVALAGSLLVGLGGVGALVAYNGGYTDKVYPGVTVDGVDVGGLGRDAARTALQKGLAKYGTGTVVVTAGDNTIRIPFDAANRRADIENALDQAFTIGRNSAFGTIFGGGAVTPTILLDDTGLARAVASAAATVDEGMIEAGVTADAKGFTTTPATSGRGIDRTALARAVSSALADPLAPDTIALKAQITDVEPDVTDKEAAAAVSLGKAMARDVVLTIGKETWKIAAARVRTWITFADDGNGTLIPTIADDAPAKLVASFAKKADHPPVEASFTWNASSAIVGVKAARNGRTVDVGATTAAVVAALRQRVTDARAGTAAAPPPAVPMTVALAAPRLSTAAAKKAAPKMRKISQWTTYYEVSERNGFGNNISIPARDLNGHVVAPGDLFDFWKSIGPVTYARGYRDGGAIINGHSAPTGALAGGICSTSTTLFNAVMRAGYETRAKKNHTYYITRYPTGLDATVVISGNSVQTMSWVNDTPYPVLIRSWASPGVVTFALYTVPVNGRGVVGGGSRTPGSTNTTYQVANGRTVKIASGPKTKYDKATSSTKQSDTLAAGKTKVVEYPVDGFNITVSRTVLVAGTVIHRDVWNSHYIRVDGLTLIGKSKPSPSPKASPSPSP